MTNLVPLAPNWLSADLRENEWRRYYLLWLSDYPSANTQRNYRTAWQELTVFLRGMTPDRITHEHIRAWRLTLMKHYGKTSVNLRLSAISSFYRFVQRNYPHLGVENPVKNVSRLTVNPYGKATILHGDQDMQLLNTIEGDTLEDARDYALLVLFLTSALRVSAVTDAKVGDLRVQGDKVFLTYRNKGGTDDTKEIPPYTYAALLAYLERRERVKKSSPLFEYRGRPMTPRLVQRIVRRRCDAAFGTGHGITPHSLRHTAAVNAARTSTILEVSSLLRHSNLRVTTIYLQHMDKSAGDQVSQRLDDRYRRA